MKKLNSESKELKIPEEDAGFLTKIHQMVENFESTVDRIWVFGRKTAFAALPLCIPQDIKGILDACGRS